MSTSTKYTRINIDLRRAEILRLLARGESQRSISEKIGCSPALVSLDVQFLHEKAREELRSHLSDKLPFEYSRALTGINNILRKGHEILDKTTDPKLQFQFMTLLMQCYANIMSLATDGGIIQEAMKKVESISSRNRENTEEPLVPNDTKVSEDEDIQEDIEEE